MSLCEENKNAPLPVKQPPQDDTEALAKRAARGCRLGLVGPRRCWMFPFDDIRFH